jgi:hypothetical protein
MQAAIKWGHLRPRAENVHWLAQGITEGVLSEPRAYTLNKSGRGGSVTQVVVCAPQKSGIGCQSKDLEAATLRQAAEDFRYFRVAAHYRGASGTFVRWWRGVLSTGGKSQNRLHRRRVIDSRMMLGLRTSLDPAQGPLNSCRLSDVTPTAPRCTSELMHTEPNPAHKIAYAYPSSWGCPQLLYPINIATVAI